MKCFRVLFLVIFFYFLYLSSLAQVQEILPSGIAPAGADVVFTGRWLALLILLLCRVRSRL